jgi:hypothetical protein
MALLSVASRPTSLSPASTLYFARRTSKASSVHNRPRTKKAIKLFLRWEMGTFKTVQQCTFISCGASKSLAESCFIPASYGINYLGRHGCESCVRQGR